MWMGSGGKRGKHGVGILLHQRWASCVRRFSAKSERLAELELDVETMRITLIAVYLPHGGYSDEEVDHHYDLMSSMIKRARKGRRRVMIYGDWNAEVGGDDGEGRGEDR